MSNTPLNIAVGGEVLTDWVGMRKVWETIFDDRIVVTTPGRPTELTEGPSIGARVSTIG